MRKRQKEAILISFLKEKQKYEKLADYMIHLIKDDPASPKESLHTITYRIKDKVRLIQKIDEENKQADRFRPLDIENTRQIFSLAFDRESKYLMYGDNQLMHIHPVDIEDIYSKLRQKTGGRELSQQEWNYYVKGDLVRPDSGN